MRNITAISITISELKELLQIDDFGECYVLNLKYKIGKKLFFSILICFVILSFILKQFDYKEIDPNSAVKISLIHPTLPNVDLLVPAAYIGPRVLNVSRKNLEGGEQRALQLRFLYPSMEPLPLDSSDHSNHYNDIPVFWVSVSLSIPRGNRHAIELKTKSKNSRYKPTETICGFQKYEELSDFHIGHTLYHYFDKDAKNDIYVNCGKKYCRVEMVSESPLSSEIYFSYVINTLPKDLICNTKQIKANISNRVGQFIIEGANR